MSVEGRFKEKYKTGNASWDIGKPDFNLIETVTKTSIKNCKALDVGCGTGDNSVWFAQQHFQITGTDFSGIAIEKARKKASKFRNSFADFKPFRVESSKSNEVLGLYNAKTGRRIV